MEPTTPTPAQPTPIMDVAPPKPDAEPALAQPPAEDPADTDSPSPAAPAAPLPKPVHIAKAKAPKQASGEPTLAIALAVTFFLVLSAAAFYAYLQSN